ncbi:MAG: UDP-N-acetylmuramate dehydrogenase [Bacteroidia bacterium]|nr:UDP-N-acetylmuramate dehydrogenase [Bacteroidia bacterium]
MPVAAPAPPLTLPLSIHNDYPLDRLNTFGVRARGRYYVKVTHPAQVAELVAKRPFQENPRFMLGGGSNILFRGDYPGLIIHVAIDYISIASIDPEYYFVEAGAGVDWHDFVLYAVQRGWAGIENLALIPGTVGGAPIQNIGAYGAEVADCIERVNAYDFFEDEFVVFTNAECRFGYRDSVFKHPDNRSRYCVTSVVFRLQRTKNPRLRLDYPALKDALHERKIYEPTLGDVCETVIAIRQSKLPDPYLLGNTGSFFKNPVVDVAQAEALLKAHPTAPNYPKRDGSGVKIPAAWLIEQCGWKGKRLGPVGTYDKHALVLVNHGGATGADVLKVAEAIEADVEAKFGIELEREVQVV